MKRGSLKMKSLGMLGIAAATAAGLGLAPAANAATTTAKVPAWHVVKSVNEGQNTYFSAVVATGPTSGWAFASSFTGKPVVYERTGAQTWKTVAFPGSKAEDVVLAKATSASDVWAFATVPGDKTQVFSLLNGKWTLRRTMYGDVFQATVVSSRNVTFYVPGGRYHFDGATWTEAHESISDGYAFSGSDGWTFSLAGTTVTHIDGRKHTTYNLKNLLPAKEELNGPRVAAIYAVSDKNVYVIGDGEQQDAGGPVVVLHYNGSTWTKLAGDGPGDVGQVIPDGKGGLWIPVGWAGGSAVLHFSGHQLTETLTDESPSDYVQVFQVAEIPGSTEALAVGNTYSGRGAILQYS
ncbi:MAG: hypothetical protein JWM19_6607 [Actinomycetia bacterium]|nr:hypothetical protein [Actinomycetes bacterium]